MSDKFYALKQAAVKEQNISLRGLSKEAINLMAVDYFLKSGIDYKGQFQCCYASKGGKVEVEASVDPAGIFFGAVHTEIKFSNATSAAKKKLVIVQRGPQNLDEYHVPMPIMLNCLYGWDYSIEIGVGLEVSVGVSFSGSPTSTKRSDAGKRQTTIKSTETKGGFGKESPSYSLESIAVGFEASASAGAKAEGSLKYEHFYAEDISPVPFPENDKNHVREVLGKVFKAGSYKSAIKIEACSFLNENLRYSNYGSAAESNEVKKAVQEFSTSFDYNSFSDVKSQYYGSVESTSMPGEGKSFLGNRGSADFNSSKGVKYNWIKHDSSATISELLGLIVNNSNKVSDPKVNPKDQESLQKEIKEKASSYISRLKVWADANTRPSIPTFVAISCYQAEGEAGLFAKAGVSANATILNAEVGVEAKAAEVSGSYKKSYLRYQTVYSAIKDNKSTEIVMTQETAIVYKTFEFIGVGVEVSASVDALGASVTASAGAKVGTETTVAARVGAGGIPRSRNVEKEISKSSDKLMPEWVKNLNRMTYKSTTVYWSKDMVQMKDAPALCGTGVSVGGSFLVSSLIDCYKNITKNENSEHINRYIDTIASSLEITTDNLVNFFKKLNDMDIEYLENVENMGSDSVLLEVGFSVKEHITVIDHSNESRKLIQLDKNITKKILESKNRKLESIKIRFRIQDTQNYDMTLFNLGIKASGSGGKIKLKKIEDAGSEGIVDLFTVWIDDSIKKDEYEKAVPPVVLFCQ